MKKKLFNSQGTLLLSSRMMQKGRVAFAALVAVVFVQQALLWRFWAGTSQSKSEDARYLAKRRPLPLRIGLGRDFTQQTIAATGSRGKSRAMDEERTRKEVTQMEKAEAGIRTEAADVKKEQPAALREIRAEKARAELERKQMGQAKTEVEKEEAKLDVEARRKRRPVVAASSFQAPTNQAAAAALQNEPRHRAAKKRRPLPLRIRLDELAPVDSDGLTALSRKSTYAAVTYTGERGVEGGPVTGVKPNMGTHQYGKEAERGGEEIEEEDGEDEEGSRHEDSLDEEDGDPEEALDLLDSDDDEVLKREKKGKLEKSAGLQPGSPGTGREEEASVWSLRRRRPGTGVKPNPAA